MHGNKVTKNRTKKNRPTVYVVDILTLKVKSFGQSNSEAERYVRNSGDVRRFRIVVK